MENNEETSPVLPQNEKAEKEEKQAKCVGGNHFVSKILSYRYLTTVKKTAI